MDRRTMLSRISRSVLECPVRSSSPQRKKDAVAMENGERWLPNKALYAAPEHAQY